MRFSSKLISISIIALLILSIILISMEGVYSQGNAVPGADISVRAGPGMDFGFDDRADSNGMASYDLFQGMSHEISVRARGFRSRLVRLQPVNNPGVQQLNVVLEPATLVEGYIKTPDGTPVAGVLVNSDIDSAVTNAWGYYAVYVNNTNMAQLSVTALPPLMLTAGLFDFSGFFGGQKPKKVLLGDIYRYNDFIVSKRVNVNINNQPIVMQNITVDFSARVAGTVFFDSGDPAVNATVTFMGSNFVGIGSSGIVNSFGQYSVDRDLINGPHNVTVTFSGKSWTLTLLNILKNVNINCVLPCDNPQIIDIQVPNLVRIYGRLVDQSGRPIPNVTLNGWFNQFSVFLQMTTKNDGTFEGYVPVGASGNITSLIPAGFAPIPIVTLPVNVGNSDLNLGDVVGNVNIYYVRGTLQGYDPDNLYWRDATVKVMINVSALFFQFRIDFEGTLFRNGSFLIPVFSSNAYQGGQYNLQFFVIVENAYNSFMVQPQPIPEVNQDINGVVIQPNQRPRFTLEITVEAGGQVREPSLQNMLNYIIRIGGTDYVVTVSSDGGLAAAWVVFAIYNPRGELYFLISDVPGSNTITIEFPTVLLGEPYTVSYYSFDTNDFEPLQANIQISNGVTSITFQKPDGSYDVYVRVESPSVIPEFNTIYIIALMLAVLAATYVILRRGLH